MVEFTKLIQAQFDKMCATGKLFRSSLNGNHVWDLYINGFEKKHNSIFRDPESSTHNCNLCKNFIRRYGNIVAIDDNYNIITMFDVDADEEYNPVAKSISKALKNATISEVFFETFNELNSLPYESCKRSNTKFKLGVDKNVKRYTKEEAEKFGVVKPNEIRTFNHLHLFIPKQFVVKNNISIESIMANYRDAKNVFQRAMMEIPLDTLNLVKDLINQGSLLNGKTHLFKIEQVIPMKKQYDLLPIEKRDNWCWINSFNLQFAKFKNELIGVLCTEIAEGKNLNDACQTWNKRVDPANYMKAVAPITKKQIEDAKKFVEENGYEESFNRRFATIDDIKASEILHVNIGKDKINPISIFDDIKPTSTRHKRSEFDGIDEVSIEKFMQDILPECTSVEAYLENRMIGNLVSLTTANIKESKPIFKWDNNYSWTFNGNLAGKSQIKEAVKSRGGRTDGVLNIRLAFPDTTDDYDLHVFEPDGEHIYYSNVRQKHPSTGMLDLDAQGVDGFQPPEKRVENIIYTDINRMPEEKYEVRVNNYSGRGFRTNFILEIETPEDTIVLSLKGLMDANNVHVADIILKDRKFEIIPMGKMKVVSSNSITKNMWSLDTNKFHKINLVCLSPNHWANNNVGNKHYFFMLNNCKCQTSIRSFHAENLIPELAKHRKVLEVLGNTTMIEPATKQLSGLGFNATVRDELIVKLSGSFKRIIKVRFGND